jgi:hypothetical protein
MGWLKRLLGNEERDSEALAFEVGISDLEEPDHVEVDVVGEASYQEALATIAGRRTESSKQHRVGVTLRRDPANPYDPNAVQVEVMGRVVGYVPRATAATVAPGMASAGGAVEGQGVIVGGWERADSNGHFGIRVWLAKRDADRIGLRRPDPIPDLPPPGPGEIRLSPSDELNVSAVTVTCEEHYQPGIEASRPSPDWNRDWWPCLATLVLGTNPHTGATSPSVEVRLGGQVAGYLTPAMTERHVPRILRVTDGGGVASARAHVSKGTKAGASIWRVKLALEKPPQ